MDMNVTIVELLYLRKLLVEHIEKLERTYEKYQRVLPDSDELLRQKRLGSLEAELDAMNCFKRRVITEIGKASIAESD